MDFQEAREEFLRIRAELEALPQPVAPEALERLEQATYNLVVEDEKGVHWRIGLTSGAWYRQEGDTWVEATPPGQEQAEPLLGAISASQIQAASLTVERKRFVLGAGLLAAGGAAILTVAVLCVGLLAAVWILPNPLAIAQVSPSATPAPSTVVSPTILAIPTTVTPPYFPGQEDTATPLPSGETSAVEATATELETMTGSPGPSPTASSTPLGQPNSPASARVWKSINYSTFKNEEDIAPDWAVIIDYALETEYNSYKGRQAIHLVYLDNIEIYPAYEPDDYDIVDIQMDETFAFPSGEDAGSVELLCRFQDLDNTISLSISRDQWKLSRWLEGDETSLRSGTTPAGFKNGDWGRWQLHCIGNKITVLVNGNVLAEVTDSTFSQGSWEVLINIPDDLDQVSIYLYNHQVFRAVDEKQGELLDRIQLGILNITLTHSWQTTGNQSSLGLLIDNSSSQAVTIKAEDIYLQDSNGQKFSASTAPAGTAGPPLAWPVTLTNASTQGDVYFQTTNHSGWTLVIDLSALRLGKAIFTLPSS